MKAVKVQAAANPDDREALRDLVRLLARVAAAEHVRADLRSGPFDPYDGRRGR